MVGIYPGKYCNNIQEGNTSLPSIHQGLRVVCSVLGIIVHYDASVPTDTENEVIVK